MKAIKFLSIAAIALMLASCGGKDKKEATSATTEPEEKVEAQTATVPFLSTLPIEGDQADYFAATGADGTENVVLTGTPEEDATKGTIRATVKIEVKKQFPKLKGFAVFPPMTLYFLNADKGEIQSCRLELSKPDQEAILAELKKATPGSIEVSYSGEFYASDYNSIFKDVKYVQIQSADLSDGSKSSSSDESVSGSDGEVYDYDPTYGYRKAQEIVDEANEQAKEIVNGAYEDALDAL